MKFAAKLNFVVSIWWAMLNLLSNYGSLYRKEKVDNFMAVCRLIHNTKFVIHTLRYS